MLSWEFISAAPAKRHDRRRHLPCHLRHRRADAAHDRGGRSAGGADRDLPDRVRAAEFEDRAGHPGLHRQLGGGAVDRVRSVRARVLHLHGGQAIDTRFYDGKLVYGKPSLIWASLTLAILTMPVVVVATEEALRAVPREIRDASLALGATKLQTVIRVVLPEALGGVLTGSILAISRGAGEVAPIMFTGAAYFLPYLPDARQRSVHEPELPRVRSGHAVARRRSDEAAALRDGARAACC